MGYGLRHANCQLIERHSQISPLQASPEAFAALVAKPGRGDIGVCTPQRRSSTPASPHMRAVPAAPGSGAPSEYPQALVGGRGVSNTRTCEGHRRLHGWHAQREIHPAHRGRVLCGGALALPATSGRPLRRAHVHAAGFHRHAFALRGNLLLNGIVFWLRPVDARQPREGGEAYRDGNHAPPRLWESPPLRGRDAAHPCRRALRMPLGRSTFWADTDIPFGYESWICRGKAQHKPKKWFKSGYTRGAHHRRASRRCALPPRGRAPGLTNESKTFRTGWGKPPPPSIA